VKAVERGIVDTSVFIARESTRPLDAAAMPQELAISVVTLAELQAGVLAAITVETRARRLITLTAIGDVEVLPITESVAVEWARLRVELATRGRKVNVNDLWIAATAVAHGVPVVSQDADFEALAGIAGFSAVLV
jgi:predicted nucleic acid-binding protein